MHLAPCLIPALALSLAADTPRQLQAIRTGAPLQIDGRLDEPVWKEAPVASGFQVSQPDLGAMPRNDTEVRVLYDNRFVYVGARMKHPKGAATVVQQLHRRDQDSASDWFGVYLDSLHDRTSAFLFMVNAAGVQQDRVVFQEFNEDNSWDGVWESAVSVDADGWTAEVRIPLSLLRLKPGSQTWGINFLRADHRPRKELSLWHVVPRGVNAWVSAFPELVGIEGVEPQPRRELIPYASTLRKIETAQTYDDRRFTNRAGLDAHLGIGRTSQLDLTLKPDFGQVEVDQAVLNLGTFETFLPEKRPFFLEGMELFQFTGPQLFYSRRIGRGVCGPDLATGETLVDRPAASEILGAAKWTTKTAGGFSLGVLAAHMEAARATVRRDDGSTETRELAPLTQATVLRATQALDAKGSFVGAFGSFLHQAGPTGREALVTGADLVLKSSDQARRIELSAAESLAGPRNERRDGGYARFTFDQQWKNGWSLNGALLQVGRAFDPNDLGYSTRPDRRMATLNANRSWDAPWGSLRNRTWSAWAREERDLAGHAFTRLAGTAARTEFTSGWNVQGGFERSFPTEDDRELRTFRDPEKTYFRVEATTARWINLGAPGHWPWTFSLHHDQRPWEGGMTHGTSLWHSIRPLPQLEIQAETSWNHEAGEPHYADRRHAMPIVGLRRLSSLNQTLTVAYAFSPTLTLQAFSQWMTASWAFRDLKAWTRTGSVALAEGRDRPGSSDRLWNLNLITRWEFRPGSTFFAVYTHGAANADPGPEPGRIRLRTDLSLLRRAPSDDAIQLKLSWLFR